MTKAPARLSPEEELRRVLRDLSQPALTQVVLFPDWIVPGEELRRAFADALAKHRATGVSVSTREASALAELEAYIADLSGPYDRGFWSNPSALGHDSRWQNVRDMAKAALDAFAEAAASH